MAAGKRVVGKSPVGKCERCGASRAIDAGDGLLECRECGWRWAVGGGGR